MAAAVLRQGGKMDGPTAQYLHPIDGLDAVMWVPPSSGQLFWLRRAPALAAVRRCGGAAVRRCGERS
jgi:hypothetical protein